MPNEQKPDIQLSSGTQTVVKLLQDKFMILSYEMEKIKQAYNETLHPLIPGEDKSGYQAQTNEKGEIYLKFVHSDNVAQADFSAQ